MTAFYKRIFRQCLHRLVSKTLCPGLLGVLPSPLSDQSVLYLLYVLVYSTVCNTDKIIHIGQRPYIMRQFLQSFYKLRPLCLSLSLRLNLVFLSLSVSLHAYVISGTCYFVLLIQRHSSPTTVNETSTCRLTWKRKSQKRRTGTWSHQKHRWQHQLVGQVFQMLIMVSEQWWNNLSEFEWSCLCHFRLPFLAIRATLTARDFFLAYFYPSSPFTCIFFQNLSEFFPVLAMANTGSCVGLQNKIGQPAWCGFPCWVPAEYR